MRLEHGVSLMASPEHEVWAVQDVTFVNVLLLQMRRIQHKCVPIHAAFLWLPLGFEESKSKLTLTEFKIRVKLAEEITSVIKIVMLEGEVFSLFPHFLARVASA